MDLCVLLLSIVTHLKQVKTEIFTKLIKLIYQIHIQQRPHFHVWYFLNHLLAWSSATKTDDTADAPKKIEKQQEKIIEALTKFVIAEWGLLIDHEILTINDENSAEGKNDAVNNGNDEDVRNEEDPGNNKYAWKDTCTFNWHNFQQL